MKQPLLLIILVASSLLYYSCQRNASDVEVESKAAAVSKKILLLAIDGGGIKGILPTYFLSQIEDRFVEDSLKIYQLFDVIGGTSTGGMLAMALTAPINGDNSPMSATEILDFYLNDCDSIFLPTHRPLSPAYYAEFGLEPFLRNRLTPTTTLAQAANLLPNKKVKQVFTTSYLVNSKGAIVSDPKLGVDFGPYLFNWYDAKKDSTQDYYLWEAARATSAAPLYYPIAHLGGGESPRSSALEKWAIDGGMVSGDPALWAVTESLRTGTAETIDDIILISLGCGIDRYNGGVEVTTEKINHLDGQRFGFWGALDWGADHLKNLNGDKTARSVVTETSLFANQFTPEQQLKVLADHTGLEYHRVQLELPYALTPMDACGNASSLLDAMLNFVSSVEGQAKLDTIVKVIRGNL